MRKLLVTLTVAGLALAFGAAPGVASGGNVKRFCKANLRLSSAFNADEPNFRKIDRLIDTATENAPPEIAGAVNIAGPAIQEDPESAFEDPAVLEAIGQIDAFAYEQCGYEQVEVSLEDYAFSGIPEEVERGPVAFRLQNEGTELHEMTVFRLKGDANLDDLLESSEEESEELVTFIGRGEAAPGESSYALINLKKAGNYAAVCFIPVGTTPDAGEEGGDGPPHFTEGMATEFEVTK